MTDIQLRKETRSVIPATPEDLEAARLPHLVRSLGGSEVRAGLDEQHSLRRIF